MRAQAKQRARRTGGVLIRIPMARARFFCRNPKLACPPRSAAGAPGYYKNAYKIFGYPWSPPSGPGSPGQLGVPAKKPCAIRIITEVAHCPPGRILCSTPLYPRDLPKPSVRLGCSMQPNVNTFHIFTYLFIHFSIFFHRFCVFTKNPTKIRMVLSLAD